MRYSITEENGTYEARLGADEVASSDLIKMEEDIARKLGIRIVCRGKFEETIGNMQAVFDAVKKANQTGTLDLRALQERLR